MHDRYHRRINYLRLSITERCNLRCRYCMPAGGIPLRSCGEMLSYEDLLRITRVATELGITKVRVTGGEPLVRKDILGFLSQLSALPGLDEVTLTSNGLLLEEYARALYDTGIRRLNLSLDSLDANTFAAITRGGDLERVLAGIAAAEDAGLQLKLNMVVMRGINDQEIETFAALSLDKPWSIRFIEYMPTAHDPDWPSRSLSGAEIIARLSQRYQLRELDRGLQCGPARPYRIDGALGSLGVITPMSDHFCANCNRIRVTAEGHARSCLLADQHLDLRPALGCQDDRALRRALEQVVTSKGSHHQLGDTQHGPQPFTMNQIGG